MDQEEILYFAKKRISLENSRQIAEVVIANAHIAIVSFSGSIYLYPNQNTIINNNKLDHPENQTTPLFIAFDHTLELPFTRTTVMAETPTSIELLILAPSGQAALLNVDHSKQPHKVSLQQVEVILPEGTSDHIVKSTRFIKPNQLLVVYQYCICILNLSMIQDAKRITSELVYSSEDGVDQVDYCEDILCISTFKKYFSLNLISRAVVQLGSKDKQGFFGISFFPRNQSEIAMAARPNGYMWRVSTTTGLVQTTLQFKDDENKKLRILSFDRFLLTIIGEDKLLIIDMFDRQQITKVFPGCSMLTLVPPSNSGADFFYVHYIENSSALSVERCSIKNIQKSFEESLEANCVNECAELFEKYDTLQNMRNLKQILLANKALPQPFSFSSAFKDSVKQIEDETFNWNQSLTPTQGDVQPCNQSEEINMAVVEEKLIEIDPEVKTVIPTTELTLMSLNYNPADGEQSIRGVIDSLMVEQPNRSSLPFEMLLNSWNWLIREKIRRQQMSELYLKLKARQNDRYCELQVEEEEKGDSNQNCGDDFINNLMKALNQLSRRDIQRIITESHISLITACEEEISLSLQQKSTIDLLNDTDMNLQLTLDSLARVIAYFMGVSAEKAILMILDGDF